MDRAPEALQAQAAAAGRVERVWRASLALEFVRDRGATRLARRMHSGPLLVQKPLYPEGESVCHVALIHPPGGIVEGDALLIEATLDTDAHALITTPSATRWYRSTGPVASQTVRVTLGEGSVFEWLPQENIVFDRARARLSLQLSAPASATAIGMETFVLGRAAMGERYARGDLMSETRLSLAQEGGDQLRWAERFALDATSRFAESSVGLGGRTVTSTLWAIGPALANLSNDDIDAMRERLPCCAGTNNADSVMGGLTRLPQGVLLFRTLGYAVEPVRAAALQAWSLLRPLLIGIPAAPLRLWNT